MSAPHPTPQRLITVTVHGDTFGPRITYSYWSPLTGETVLHAPRCNLQCDRPEHFLFVLDYDSTLRGWTITGTEPRKGSPALETVLGPNNLSVSNYNPHENESETYYFAILYRNTRTEAEMAVDPQENNIPPV